MGRKKKRCRRIPGETGTTRSDPHSNLEEHGAARPSLDSSQTHLEDSMRDLRISVEGGGKELHFYGNVNTVQVGDTHNFLATELYSMAEATGDDASNYEREVHIRTDFDPRPSGPDDLDRDILTHVQEIVAGYHNATEWKNNMNLCYKLISLFKEKGASLRRARFSSIHFFVVTGTGANHDRLLRACSDGTLATALTELLVTPQLVEEAGVKLEVTIRLPESSVFPVITQTTDVQVLEGRRFQDMTPNDVAEWLIHEAGISEQVAAKFQQERVDGALLADYKEEDMKKDFHLKIGELRKIQYAREKCSGLMRSSDTSLKVSNCASGKEYDKSQEEVTSTSGTETDEMSAKVPDQHHESSKRNSKTDVSALLESASSKHRSHAKEEISAEEERVRYLFTGDESGCLDIAFHPLLVVNKPLITSSEDYSPESLYERFGFTALVNWNAVFDCDSMSLTNGMCAMVQEKTELKLLSPSTFKKDLSLEEIEFNDVPAWIFTNGREDLDDISSPSLNSEWNEKYGADVDRAVDFFTTSAIPKDRAVIVFLLLSDTNIQIMSDIFKKLQSSMQGMGSFTFLVDNFELYEQWAMEIKKWLPRNELDKRSLIVGADWCRVDGHIRKLLGKTSVEPGKLPMFKGRACILSDKARSKWQNIEVLLQNECERDNVDANSLHFQELVTSVEHEFYRGNAVSWWNFFLTDGLKGRRQRYNQVLQREASKALNEIVKTKLMEPKHTSRPVVTITVFHEAGSGASTAARQVMWNHHRQVRCVIVRRAILPTVDEILQVRSFGYGAGENIPPVLVLLDDMDDNDVLDFIAQLIDANKSEDCLMFILIHCKRTPDPEAMATNNGTNSVVVKHKLSQREREWFGKKFVEYEEKHNETPERLIGFMVMKEECKPEYIQRVVSSILGDISGKEAKLLKYISVISIFMVNFGMPVSCCDEFMKAHTRLEGRGSRHLLKCVLWEKLLSNAARILLICPIIHTKQGATKMIKLVSPSIAEEIVEQLTGYHEQKIGDIVSEFIHDSGILDSKAFMNTYMAQKTQELLVRRKTSDSESGEQSKFSPLITFLLERDKSIAFRLLKEAFEKLGNGFIAQQLARLHLAEKQFDTAKYFANKAIYFQRTNSFFWDTLGRIVLAEMTAYKENTDTLLNEQDTDKLLGLLEEGMTAFRKCQEHCKTEGQFSVYSGYTGELRVMFLFLRILEQRDRSFRSTDARDVIRRYLLTNEEIPTLSGRWVATREHLKDLTGRAKMSFESVVDLLTCSKAGSVALQNKKSESYIKNEFPKLYDDLVWFFSMDIEDDPPSSVKNDPESLNEWRRAQVKSLKADTVNAIFTLAQNDKDGELTMVLRLLDQNRPKNVFDLKLLVCVHFALAFLGKNHADFDTVSQMIRELNKFDRSLYGAYFALLLAWPEESGHSSQSRNVGLSTVKAVKNLVEKWNDLMGQRSTKRSEGYRSFSRHQLSGRKPLTYFLLAKGKGFERFRHIYMFHATQSTLDEERYRFWSRAEVVEKLVRLEGTIQDTERLVFTTPTNERIYIRMSRRRRIQPSQEKVTFFLGFNFAGPVAYNVTEKRKEPLPDLVREALIPEAYPGYLLGKLHDLYQQEEGITADLDVISYNTRRRRNREQLTAEDRKLVQSKLILEKELEQIRNKIQQETEKSSDDDGFMLVVRKRRKAPASAASLT